MNVGTKSVLFGAHQFLLHPLFVAAAWWRLFGFPWDHRLWVAFIVHDLGYWGKPNMDGPEGETHPQLGAEIMRRLFDSGWEVAWRWSDQGKLVCGRYWNCSGGKRLIGRDSSTQWRDFTLYHSRFFAKKEGKNPSRLCVADKLATVLMPWWLYLPLVNLTGEIHEYMDVAHHREGGRYSNECRIMGSQREWFASMCEYMNRWIAAHREGQPDTWTPSSNA